MFELFKRYYQWGISAEVIYLSIRNNPAYGLTPLDYEEITGQPWPDKKEPD